MSMQQLTSNINSQYPLHMRSETRGRCKLIPADWHGVAQGSPYIRQLLTEHTTDMQAKSFVVQVCEMCLVDPDLATAPMVQARSCLTIVVQSTVCASGYHKQVGRHG